MDKTGIAIIGMGCEFPDASSPSQLWLNSLKGRQSFRAIPDARLRTADYPRDATDPDSITATHAAVIADYAFPREEFGVSGATYRSTDMAHWLALDVASRAIVDAGLDSMSDTLREQTGVIIGNTLTGEFSRARAMRAREPIFLRMLGAALESAAGDLQVDDIASAFQAHFRAVFPAFDSDTLAGSLANTIAGRICNHFDFGGGGYTMDGACASSLLAVINGARALMTKEVRVAVVGGVDLSLDPFELMGFSRVGALSTESNMHVFDASPTGFLPGEGAGCLVLVREDDPLTQEIEPYAIIRGWGVASDGHGGITRPEATGQTRSLRRAYDMAGWEFGSIGYLEAHGTATAVGDETELQTIVSMAESSAQVGKPIVVSSVKANIGHTKAAAGVAGLIRAISAVSHGVLPPLPGPANHEVLCGSSRIRRLAQAETWAGPGLRRAGVSSMGFGGIDAHVVIEQPRESARVLTSSVIPRFAPGPHILTATGFTRDAAVDRLASLVEPVAFGVSVGELGDYATRSHQYLDPSETWRAVVVADDIDHFLAAVAALQEDDSPVGHTAWVRDSRNSSLGFIFSGQGGKKMTATAAMGSAEATHRSIADETAASIEQLNSARIVADFAIGHSLGELSAMYWAGVWSSRQFAEVLGLRGALLDQLPTPHGSMISIGAPPAEVADALPRACTIAAHNGSHTVVAGLDRPLSHMIDLADHYGWSVTRLNVTHAFHTDVVRGAAEKFAAQMSFDSVPSRPVISTVTGRQLNASLDVPDHLRRQMVQPVLFDEAIREAAASVWVIVGPRAGLGGLVQDIARDSITVELSPKTPLTDAPQVIAAAWVAGCDVDWGRLETWPSPDALRKTAPTFLPNPCELAPNPGSKVIPAPNLIVDDEGAVGSYTGEADGAMKDAHVREIVLTVISERTELPKETLEDQLALGTDLHLNSIVIGQLIVEAAGKIGVPVPLHVNDYASATIGAVIDGLVNGPTIDEDIGELPPPADAWTALFEAHESLVRPPTRGEACCATRPEIVDLGWAEMSAALAVGPSMPNTFVVVTDALKEPDDAWRVLTAIRDRPRETQRVALVERAGRYSAAAILRTLVAESPEICTSVIRCDGDVGTQGAGHISQALTGMDGHSEYGFDGTHFTQTSLRRFDLEDTEDVGLGYGDRILISGGARGLGLATAEYLASEYGVSVELLGRTPAQAPDIRDALRRIRQYGGGVNYHQVDIANPTKVREILGSITRTGKPITGFIHSAGVNKPSSIENITREVFTQSIAVKIGGIENVLSSLDLRKLKFIIAYSSIIARTGLHGEAHYAISNDWLNTWMNRLQTENPEIRATSIEWSAWAGVGMGHQLGVLDQLRRSGVDPITPRKGIELLERVLRAGDAPTVVTATGRFGDPPTVRFDAPVLESGRFLGHPVVQVADCELITDTVISTATDPYLLDHQVVDDIVIPLVMLLEAAAQHAAALSSRTDLPRFEHVHIQQAIVVPRFGDSTLRTCAVRVLDTSVTIAIRSSQSDFKVDHLRLVCRWDKDAIGHAAGPPVSDEIEVDPRVDLYGVRLFQSGRFAGVGSYGALTGTNFTVNLVSLGVESNNWFSRDLTSKMILGDPGVRDSGLQAAQACFPDQALLPVGVRDIEIMRPPVGHVTVVGAEIRRPTDPTRGSIFDLDFYDEQGIFECWRGVNFRPWRSVPYDTTLSIGLLGPLIERRLINLDFPWVGAVALGFAKRSGRRAELEQAIKRRRKPWGSDVGNRWFESFSHSDGISVAVTATQPIGVDLVCRDNFLNGELPLNGRDSEMGDKPERAASLWAAREAYFKATGQRPVHRLLDDGQAGEQSFYRHGECRIWTSPVRVNDRSMYVAVAIDGDVRDA